MKLWKPEAHERKVARAILLWVIGIISTLFVLNYFLLYFAAGVIVVILTLLLYTAFAPLRK